MSLKKPLLTLTLLLITIKNYPSLITISGNPKPLIITKATAGDQPMSVCDTSTTCTITISPKKTVSIIAALDSAPDPHTNLKMKIASTHRNLINPFITLQCFPQVLCSVTNEGIYEGLVA